jgi:hypothetical protein
MGGKIFVTGGVGYIGELGFHHLLLLLSGAAVEGPRWGQPPDSRLPRMLREQQPAAM